jgi:hypothetical protein
MVGESSTDSLNDVKLTEIKIYAGNKSYTCCHDSILVHDGFTSLKYDKWLLQQPYAR